jgi:hypothetical protein
VPDPPVFGDTEPPCSLVFTAARRGALIYRAVSLGQAGQTPDLSGRVPSRLHRDGEIKAKVAINNQFTRSAGLVSSFPPITPHTLSLGTINYVLVLSSLHYVTLADQYY